MSISDELQKLDELHRNGALSRDEFEIAKRKVLEGSPSADSDQLEEIKAQNELAQLDRGWELERENYMVTGKYGNKHIPGQASSLFGGIFLVAFGIFWTVMASSITSSGFGPGPGGGFSSFFPLFGVLFILFGIGVSITGFIKAGKYRDAHEKYQRRRRALLDENRQSR